MRKSTSSKKRLERIVLGEKMKRYLQIIKYKIIFLFVLSFSLNSFADNEIPTLEILVPRNSINIGEPLVVELKYHFKETQISNKNEISKQIEPEAYLCIQKKGATINNERLTYPFLLTLQDEAGLEYKGTFIIWYNVLGKKLSLDEPGEYTLRTSLLPNKFLSNPLQIMVKSGNKNALESLTVLTDLYDYLFLYTGTEEFSKKRDGVIERLKLVEKQSQGTMLENWSSARIGIAYFKDIK